MKGNTVGSTNTNFCKIFSNPSDAYILGLWCADGYHWTSSVGITNIDWELIDKFKNFFLKRFAPERLRLKIYEPVYNYPRVEKSIPAVYFTSVKARHPAYQLYVNSRSLLREFIHLRSRISKMKDLKIIWPYIAGRFDGDGSIDKQFDRDCRIVYSNIKEAQTAQRLLKRVGLDRTKVYHYKSAHTFCVYISRLQTKKFIQGIHPYSVRMQKLVFVPRRDLAPKAFGTR